MACRFCSSSGCCIHYHHAILMLLLLENSFGSFFSLLPFLSSWNSPDFGSGSFSLVKKGMCFRSSSYKKNRFVAFLLMLHFLSASRRLLRCRRNNEREVLWFKSSCSFPVSSLVSCPFRVSKFIRLMTLMSPEPGLHSFLGRESFWFTMRGKKSESVVCLPPGLFSVHC